MKLQPQLLQFQILKPFLLSILEYQTWKWKSKSSKTLIALIATIKSKVLMAVEEYLGTSLGDALHKVLQKHTVEFIKEHPVPADVVEELKQHQKP
ncbi:hypothetical protein Tco_0097505 [Tanacetum coccineum]